jgi:hypothetical protein
VSFVTILNFLFFTYKINTEAHYTLDVRSIEELNELHIQEEEEKRRKYNIRIDRMKEDKWKIINVQCKADE